MKALCAAGATCLALVGCIGGAGDESEKGLTIEVIPELECGSTRNGAVRGASRQSMYFHSTAHQMVTLQYSATYRPEHGAVLEVFAGQASTAGWPIAEVLVPEQARGRVSFWATEEGWYTVRAGAQYDFTPFSNEYDINLAGISEAIGDVSVSASCEGAVSCGARVGLVGTCMGTDYCAFAGGTSTAGLCPGPRDVQCCASAAPRSDPTGEPPPSNGASCASYDWSTYCVSCDGIIDAGDGCCTTDIEDDSCHAQI